MSGRSLLLFALLLGLSACTERDSSEPSGAAAIASALAGGTAGTHAAETPTEISLHAELPAEATPRDELLTAYAAALRASRGASAASGATPSFPMQVRVDAEADAVRDLYLTAYQATFRAAQRAGAEQLETLKQRLGRHREFVRAWTSRPVEIEAPAAETAAQAVRQAPAGTPSGAAK